MHPPARPRPRPRGTGGARAVVVRAVVVITALVLGLGACTRPATPAALLAQGTPLRGASYVVAGGPTTELRLLCQLTIAAVQAAGATYVDECGKVGAVDVRLPATQTDVDTGWAALHDTEHLDGGAPVPWDAVRAADAPRGVTWLPPTVAGDTDVVVVRSGAPGGTGTPTGISDLAVRSRGVPTTLCAPPRDVPDGTATLLAAYGFGPATTVVPAGDGASAATGKDDGASAATGKGDRASAATGDGDGASAATEEGDDAVLAGVATGRCTAGLVAGDSGRIPALGLVVLPDERGVLTSGPVGPGGWAPLLRTPVVAAHPQVVGVLAAVTGRLDGPAMRGMVREVDVDGRDPRDAARRWLVAQGLIARN